MFWIALWISLHAPIAPHAAQKHCVILSDKWPRNAATAVCTMN
jgi:hypothetical protein